MTLFLKIRIFPPQSKGNTDKLKNKTDFSEKLKYYFSLKMTLNVTFKSEKSVLFSFVRCFLKFQQSFNKF